MDKDTIAAVAIGIGLAASCGFRVFVPLLVAGIAERAGVLPLNEGFQWLASCPAIFCFGTATVLEILAYYIPFVDNLLDTITTPLAIAAGTLLFTSVLPVEDDFLRWTTGIIFGGGAAATVQAGTALTRLFSTKLTAGAGNDVVATGEHAAALGTSILSLFTPFLIAIIFILFITFLILKFGRRLYSGKKT
jgi:hypothetical protein